MPGAVPVRHRAARVPNGTGGLGLSVQFEQYERHTAWDRPGGVANRSGAGDLDVIIYSARKWARLALDGNPEQEAVIPGAWRCEAGIVDICAHGGVRKYPLSSCLPPEGRPASGRVGEMYLSRVGRAPESRPETLPIQPL